MHWSNQLVKIEACSEAVSWAKGQPDAQTAWDACRRGDWMLWVIGRTINCDPWSDGRKPLLACSLDCALTAKHLWPERQKDKIAGAVKVLRKWINGKATVEEAKQANNDLDDDAYAAAFAAFDAFAADADTDNAAAYAAYAAAYSVAFAADAADAAADAAYASSYAAAFAADAAVYTADAPLAKCAKIIRKRKHYPNPPQATRKAA